MAGSTDAAGPPVRPVIPSERYRARIDAARRGLAAAGADAVLVGVGADLRYLTGYVALPLERLTMLVLPATGPATLVVPRLETTPAAGSPAAVAGLVGIAAWDETDDPYALVGRRIPGPPERLLLSDRLWAMHVLGLRRAMPGAELGLATPVLREGRMRKDADEVALLRLAAHAADRVVARIAAGRLIGRTEADVSREVRERLLEEGHETSEFAIVASGPNSASPHHEAGDRVIRAGEPIVLDIGGSLGGYASDITRTLWVTGGDGGSGPTPEFLHVFGLVREAQAAATRAVRPGIGCGALDGIARDVITAGGFGDRFIHRLGHGIGLEGHEEPYLVAGNGEGLPIGAAFSIEPGIYIDGRYGSRLEDIVVCGPDGPDVLNEAPLDLHIVDGR